ncbi:MAG: low specificity L-threonine aldolase [Prevotellaceae bacterium]|jgi:threonine aldolase|nr:low specificity L-threonine aldolase [Prevotellaceae bacterium]
MKSFASDNNSGIHPNILRAIERANVGHVIGYGDDPYTKQSDDRIRELFGGNIIPHYVFNGTGANAIALQALTQPYNLILTASTGHIYVDECGTPVKTTGCLLKGIETPDGKLTPELIAPHLTGFGDQHHSQPKVISISQPTEMGTVYTPDQTRRITALAHEHNMYVHMDGSRLANACAHLGLSMRELSRDCGIDVLSLGGTKNGMMMGEVVVPFRYEPAENMRFYRKQTTQLYSKMRFLAAQFLAYFENDLWLKNALHANEMAKLLAQKLMELPDVRLTQAVESNAVFLTMPRKKIDASLQSYFFYFWNEKINEIRLVCSWDTTEDDLTAFVEMLRTL